MVSAAVAGDDLKSVAASTAEALGRPVAIALPALGIPVVSPADAVAPGLLRALLEHATSMIDGNAGSAPAGVGELVPARIGSDVVGFVAALGNAAPAADQRSWLEAAAAAAAVSALMRGADGIEVESARSALLLALMARRPADAGTFVAHARQLGVELGGGGVALCMRALGPVALPEQALVAQLKERLIALMPIGPEVEALVARLGAEGAPIATSAPRRDPAALHDALREAELMLALSEQRDSLLGGEETYRLLIGVLLRDPAELEHLRASTISPLASYDAKHDTELLATLETFLDHHGSTTETADAMSLHRHTVGYRLSRVHEVSGLSPYESDGRERLSLGLKAHHILEVASPAA